MIDSIDSELVPEDDDFSRVEVVWVGPSSGTVMVAGGVDVDTNETVEWAGDHRSMENLAQALTIDEGPVYALVPYWAERFRRAYETA